MFADDRTTPFSVFLLGLERANCESNLAWQSRQCSMVNCHLPPKLPSDPVASQAVWLLVEHEFCILKCAAPFFKLLLVLGSRICASVSSIVCIKLSTLKMAATSGSSAETACNDLICGMLPVTFCRLFQTNMACIRELFIFRRLIIWKLL